MKEIELTQGKFAIVDDEDFEELSKHKWYCHHGYATRRIVMSKGEKKTIGMHTAIIGGREGLEIDHINGNGLDNRKENLRRATTAQNQYNQKSRENTSSRYKGVYWKKSAKKWTACIGIDRKQYYLGNYNDERDAAIAYNEAAALLFGTYARPNVIAQGRENLCPR